MNKVFIATLVALIITGIYAVTATVKLNHAKIAIEEDKEYIRIADSLAYKVMEDNNLLDKDGSDTMQEFLEYTNQ